MAIQVFKDILSYYPPFVLNDDYANFAIMRFEDLTQSFNQTNLAKYKAPHLRDFFEISIGISEYNAASIQIGTEQLVSKDRDLTFVSPHQTFSIQFKNQSNILADKGFVIAFAPSFLVSRKRSFEIIHRFSFFNSHTHPQYILTLAQLQPIVNIAHTMFDEYSHDTSYATEILQGYLEVLLYTLKRTLSLSPIRAASTPCKQIAIRFEQCIINDHNNLSTIGNYASRLNISAGYLSECVKKTTGKSAQQILLSHKLIVAKNLLLQENKSISEVAYEMGFSEPTNFAKFFKQATGVAPGKFRAANN